MAQSKQIKGKKVVHITTVHSSLDVRIFHKQCRSLTKAGFEVHLVAPGCEKKVIDGVFLHGIPKAPGGRFGRMTLGVLAVYTRAARLDADIYHFHDPELLLMGLLLKLRGKRVIYDAHEDVPRQILSKHWILEPARRLVSRLFERVENFIARRLDAVLAATPFIRDRFLKIGCKSLDINNYPLLVEFGDENHESSTKEMAVCYVGGISGIRGVFEMIEAVREAGVRLLLAGKFECEEERRRARAMPGWQLVEEHGQVSRETVAELMARSIAGLVIFHPVSNHVNAQPNKMFEYMSAGIPIIASDFALWKEIIEGTPSGICVDPLNPGKIAKAIREIIANPAEATRMGRNGRSAVEEKYNWENESLKLLGLYEELLLQ